MYNKETMVQVFIQYGATDSIPCYRALFCQGLTVLPILLLSLKPVITKSDSLEFELTKQILSLFFIVDASRLPTSH